MQYSYDEVLEKIESTHRFGNQPGVEVTGRMLEKLGNPQQNLPYIHVAGTNGKGSVCAFLDRILREFGKKVGRFTSPHLVDFRERITVNGQMISHADVARLGNILLSVDFGITPTMFDYCLTMAILYFREQQCDMVIIETGLGGRLDSTNALGRPKLVVITRIGYDHTAILGDTLTEIAEEKAGILKEKVPAVFAPQEPEALQVLIQRAQELGLAYHVVTEEEIQRAKTYQPGLLGAYQLENAAVASAAMRMLELSTDTARLEQTIAKGIHDSRWPGRMEILTEHPFFMVDGAHNSSGIRALRDSLRKLYPNEKFHFIMGVMADKDYEEMVELLLPLALDFVTVTPESHRALQGEELAEYIRSRNVPARTMQNIQEISSLPVEGERTIALGSLYFIGELEAMYGIHL